MHAVSLSFPFKFSITSKRKIFLGISWYNGFHNFARTCNAWLERLRDSYTAMKQAFCIFEFLQLSFPSQVKGKMQIFQGCPDTMIVHNGMGRDTHKLEIEIVKEKTASCSIGLGCMALYGMSWCQDSNWTYTYTYTPLLYDKGMLTREFMLEWIEMDFTISHACTMPDWRGYATNIWWSQTWSLKICASCNCR